MAEQKLLSMLPEEFRPTYREILTIPDPEVRALVKAADKLSAYLKCVEELKAGNLEFKKAGEQTYEALRQNPLPALAYFMERFLPGFHLTLDELQGSGDEIFGQTTLDLTSGKDRTDDSRSHIWKGRYTAMKAIVTVIGKDQVGITAAVCSLLAQHSINILDISQTILQEYFTMVMLVDTTACDKSIVEISQLLEDAGRERNLSIRIQREDIFNAMHRI